jgi:hypothetical protein
MRSPAYHGARAENPSFNVTVHRNFDPAVSMVDGYPNAAFTLMRTAPAEEAEDEYRLGTFELRENLSVGEK